MLSRFISKSSHLRLVALLSSKTHFLNPKPISPVPSISIPNIYYNNSHFFFSTGNNNNGKDFWKLSSENEESVFDEDSTSVEEIERQALDDDGSWAKQDEEINDVFKQEKGVSVEDDNWVTAQGYKPWSFDTEDAGDKVFDDVKVDQTEMHGFDQAEDKVKENPEEKKLLDLEERALTEVLKGPNRAFGDLIAASGITEEMLDSLLALKDLDGIQGLPPLSEIEDMRYEKNTRKSSRADIERQKQDEEAKARVKQVDEKGRAYGTGRRKCSIARVWVEPGDGKFKVNDKEFDVYFPMLDHRAVLLRPFTETKTLGMWDVRCTVKGGGVSGQVGAIQLGISRALQNWDPELRPPLREGGYLTRDSRVVERKKPGKAKARKSFQWVKR